MRKSALKKEILLRLRRIEGQIRGIQKMVESDLPCVDILTQVAAATAAIKGVGKIAVQTYMAKCLEERPEKKKETLRDLQKVISQYIDWA